MDISSFINYFSSLDLELFRILNNLAGHSSTINNIIVFFASYLAFILPIIFIFWLFYYNRSLIERFSVLGTMFVAISIDYFFLIPLIHWMYYRPRPFLTYSVNQLISENSYSFPSMHATIFFTFSTIIYFYNRKLGICFFALTLLMTIGRVISGIHYPSDILAGMIFGVCVGYVVFNYITPYLDKKIEETL